MDFEIKYGQIAEEIEELLIHGHSTESLPKGIENFLLEQEHFSATDQPTDLLWKAHLISQFLIRAAHEPDLLTEEIASPAIESAPYCVFEAGKRIKTALQKKDLPRVKEAFILLKVTKQLLHPVALPIALSNLDRSYGLWVHWNHVVGERAGWLAAMRKDWSWWKDLTNGGPFNLKKLIWSTLWSEEFDEKCLSSLSAQDWKDFLKFLVSLPALGSIKVLQYLQRSTKSKSLGNSALNHLLVISGSPQNNQVNHFVESFCKENLFVENRSLKWREDYKWPDNSPSFHWETIDLYQNYFANPLFRILSLSDYESMFTHLEIDEQSLCRELILREPLERLGQAVILSLATHPYYQRQFTLIEQWIHHYPDGNTVVLDLSPLIKRLDSKQADKLIRQILHFENDEYLLERISLVCKDLECYLSTSISNLICRTILQMVEYGISHTDKRNIKECLPNLQYRLDPKSLLTLRKIWPDDALHYSDLNKPFFLFRETLEERYELFLYISGSK